jgi:SAM-dependent methyltransferase
MEDLPDYFANHRLKLRFPWSLYHRPIVEALQAVVTSCPGTDVLNLGSGPFFELSLLEDCGRRFTVCDIDPRAIELARARYGARLAGADVIAKDRPLPYADDSFDAVVSMEVIEHVVEPLAWVKEALRVLKPGGLLFLTTPNYGSATLRVLERTALEAIARLQRFTREGLHPTKLDAALLGKTLRDAGLKSVDVRSVAFNWVLTAYGRKS